MKNKNFIVAVGLIVILIMMLVVLTGCGSENEENQIQNVENTENLQENEEENLGVQVGDNLLKYGTYIGKDLANGTTITLNKDKTFTYKDNTNSGSGTYEVSYEEMEDTEGTFYCWVIKLNSLNTVSKGYIPTDEYMLFTQTGDISAEEAGINFEYSEEITNSIND